MSVVPNTFSANNNRNVSGVFESSRIDYKLLERNELDIKVISIRFEFDTHESQGILFPAPSQSDYEDMPSIRCFCFSFFDVAIEKYSDQDRCRRFLFSPVKFLSSTLVQCSLMLLHNKDQVQSHFDLLCMSVCVRSYCEACCLVRANLCILCLHNAYSSYSHFKSQHPKSNLIKT